MENNTFSLVIGYPYWNAFYWLISAEGWRKEPLRKIPSNDHPYYKNLYNFNDINKLDEVASMCLMYDEIYFSFADCWLPDSEKYTEGKNYMNNSLGIYSSQQWNERFFNDWEFVEEISKNLPLSLIPINFRYNDKNDYRVFVRDILSQIQLAIKFNCSLLVGKKFEMLYLYLAKYTDGEVINEFISKAKKIQSGLRNIQTINGILFKLKSFEEFKDLRHNSKIKEYGSHLKTRLMNLPGEKFDERIFLESMMNIMETSTLSDKIGSGLNVSSKVLDVAGLVTAGLTTAIGSATANYLEKTITDPKDHWWSLYPEINETLTKHRTEKRLKELRLKDE